MLYIRPMCTKDLEVLSPYLKQLIDELSPTKTVLEIGFSLASPFIAGRNPERYVILEKEKLEEAKKWAKDKPHVSVLEKSLGDDDLGLFDLIFFGDFSLQTEALYADKANSLLKSGKNLLSEVQKLVPDLTKTHYSDNDLELFYKELGSNLAGLSEFVYELKQNKQISEDQYTRFIKKHNLSTPKPAKLSAKPIEDPLLPLLELGLAKHLPIKGQFVCFSTNPVSKFENSQFFDRIITNPNYDYSERKVQIQGCSENSLLKTALIIKVGKFA